MFGYIVMNKPEIKFKDFDLYRSFYCGLCRELKSKYGISGQISLTYDMTFVVILLSALYEPHTQKGSTRCIIHPVCKQPVRRNTVTEYAADMNVLLTYYKCRDDWEDEKKVTALGYSKVLQGKVKKLDQKYPDKSRRIQKLLSELSEMEKSGEKDIDKMAGCFGKIMEEIFAWKQDVWEENVDNVDKSVDNVENVRQMATDPVENRPEPPCSAPEETKKVPEMPAEPAPESLLPQEEPWRLAGEVLNTYIIVEQGDKVLFIDKHAAHERMNFDRMKAEGYDPMSQTLLAPAVCRLSPEEHAALTARLPLLEEFGFAAEDFGGGALIVRQAPFDVDPGDIEATLTEIARKLLSTGSADPAAARDELLHTMACKAAIKGGWRTSPQELERVARAVMSGQVRYCPHGRPVAIELTRGQLEKQFKRA